MSEIVIGKKSKAILESFAEIEKSIIIRDDYLFTRNTSISALYTLPKGEIVSEEEFGLTDVKEFLTIEEFLDEETKEIERDGNSIVIGDDNKSFTYTTGFIEVMNKINLKGLNKFDESEDKVCKFIITNEDVANMKRFSSVLKVDKVYVESIEGEMYIVLLNTANDNESKIKLEGTTEVDDFKMEIGDKTTKTQPFYDVLYSGDYEVEIRKIAADTVVVKFSSIQINSKEEGELIYVTAKKLDKDV